MLAPTLFFMVVFCVIVLTRNLMSLESGIGALTYAAAILGALIIGKSVLIADALPIWHHFDNKSRIALIVGRTIVYALVALLFQFLEEVIPLARSEGSFVVGLDKLAEEIHWARFWGTHIQLLTFLALYNTLAVIAEELGRERFTRLLFGKSGAAG
tara:strand:- start:6671 stop:7138 length:468 start_codon:yes stop_codon:yes gene_type:complete